MIGLEEINKNENEIQESIDDSSIVIKEHHEVKVSGGKIYQFLKRTFDIISSGLVLLIFGWIILLLMLIKYLEDVGAKTYKLDIKPATEKTKKRFKQVSKDGRVWEVKVVPDPNGEKDKTVHGPIYTSFRAGKNGKVFKFHKIRSMCKGAEGMKKQLMEYGINEADEPAFKLKYDPRITRFGYFLRKTSLDELPQLWDIFVGKMSVVGPRSPIPEEVKSYDEYQKKRLLVKGGLICTWQISKNRNQLTFDEWIKLDIDYIEHRSLWLDLKIIIKAVWFVLTDHTGE